MKGAAQLAEENNNEFAIEFEFVSNGDVTLALPMGKVKAQSDDGFRGQVFGPQGNPGDADGATPRIMFEAFFADKAEAEESVREEVTSRVNEITEFMSSWAEPGIREMVGLSLSPQVLAIIDRQRQFIDDRLDQSTSVTRSGTGFLTEVFMGAWEDEGPLIHVQWFPTLVDAVGFARFCASGETA